MSESQLNKDLLRDQIQSLAPWFHNIELASGVWTNEGSDYPQRRWEYIEPVLGDVAGLDCLDVGCSSGFFSLELAKRGAHVLGIDHGEQTLAIQQATFAVQTLGVEADILPWSVYDVTALDRRFDLVLFMGVLYHLRYPLLALDELAKVCCGRMIFQTVTLPHSRPRVTAPEGDLSLHSPKLLIPGAPVMRFLENGCDGDLSDCWLPNVQAVFGMLRSAGFTIDQVVYPNLHEVIISCRGI